MGRIIRGTWDCKYCGTKNISAGVNSCPNCGRSKDKDTEFKVDNGEVVTDQKEIEYARTVGPDWLCPYCESLNRGNVEVCTNCGHPRESTDKDYFQLKENREPKEAIEAHETDDTSESSDTISNEEHSWTPYDEHRDDFSEKSYFQEANQEASHHTTAEELQRTIENDGTTIRSRLKESFGNFFGGLVDFASENKSKLFSITAVLLVVSLLLFLFIPRTEEIQITGFEWNRSIDVEELVTVDESAWSMPPEGRLHYTNREIRTYQDVLDHYETKTRTYTVQVLDHYETYVSGYTDLGNGYFEERTSQRPVYKTETKTETYQEPVYRKEPVYDTKYYYEIDRWLTQYASKSSGNDQEPYWNVPDLKDKQREGIKRETYTLVGLNKKGKERRFEFDFDTWKSLKAGETVKVKSNSAGFAELVKEN